MSEFKFACPLCGQHMMCDASQGGSVMECPTCFQKIVAPQAPAPDTKFILTGTKLTEKKIFGRGMEVLSTAPKKNFPLTILLLLLVGMLAGGATVYFILKKPPGPKLPQPPALSKQGVWTAGDIGDPGAGGSFTESKGVFTINGSGADIWQQEDGFYFVFQKLRGDGSLTAEILEVKDTHEWAKGGVMIRDDTSAASAFALASIRADGQSQYIWRSDSPGAADASQLAGGTGYPKWVRITRDGDIFSAEFKTRAEGTWQPMGFPQVIYMGEEVQIGLAVCSHVAGVMGKAVFDHVTLQTGSTRPPLVAPPANDRWWMLTLDNNAIPDSNVAGRIHGQDFIMERASFQNGTLTLRYGTRGPVDIGVQINFGGAQPESLSGKNINVTEDAVLAARVTLCWMEGNAIMRATYTNGYALRLEFGRLVGNRLPGKIHLCTPDEKKSYLLGSFVADARKPKPPSN